MPSTTLRSDQEKCLLLTSPLIDTFKSSVAWPYNAPQVHTMKDSPNLRTLPLPGLHQTEYMLHSSELVNTPASTAASIFALFVAVTSSLWSQQSSTAALT